ncbi:MAG: NIPSNAP family protein [Phenylobacterium sp.]|uniref:NIPSNAP family protein n=1 Tax=Phenylobacterium sp. TaxID=1871053 RepID=UPI0027350D6C|nr:NIPSNAP family protein [Phenylobacterium sp.]MDP3175028.1 NIPSNAP family protein [Phenylobacterium sp.]
MIYELRIYEPVEGRTEALRDRLLNRAMPMMPDHRIEVVAAFTPTPDDGRVVYLCRFEDEDARAAAWAAFAADPRWKSLREETEVDGPLIKTMASTLMRSALSGADKF